MDHAPTGVLMAFGASLYAWANQHNTIGGWINCACTGFASLLDAFSIRQSLWVQLLLPQAFSFEEKVSRTTGGKGGKPPLSTLHVPRTGTLNT